MKWGAVGRRRLLKLAEHLESGKLGHEKFDFSIMNEGRTDERGCGTVGNAIGELPILFPKQWCFRSVVYALLKSHSTRYPIHDAAGFFGISVDDAVRLFICSYQRPWTTGILEKTATRLQVAKSIRKFILWKDRQESQLK